MMRRSAAMAHRGFTLIELIVALAIVGILVTIAQVAWGEHRLRAGRSDATVALLTLAAHQEAYYLETGRYASDPSRGPPAGLGLTGTERGWYRLEIRAADVAGYTAVAVPVRGSPQARDSRCQRFSIDATGRRGSAPAPPSVCWR
jgi:type IV pilus assembly protein PilE